MVPFRPALKRVIKMRNDSRSAEALRFPHECGGSHQCGESQERREQTYWMASVRIGTAGGGAGR